MEKTLDIRKTLTVTFQLLDMDSAMNTTQRYKTILGMPDL
tara:strand:- start:545 stop:664 length:120 start_codon:yes stop_codon:yes gene_type:complete